MSQKHSGDGSDENKSAKKTKTENGHTENGHSENAHTATDLQSKSFNQETRLDYAVVYTNDVKKSSTIFQEVFGFKLSGPVEWRSDKWMEFQSPAYTAAATSKIAFHLIGEDTSNKAPGSVQLSLIVRDIQKVHEELSKREGVKVESAPKKQDYGIHALYALPDGVTLSVIEESGPKKSFGICHLDVAVEDMERSQKFYKEAFGWSFKQYTPEYSIFESNDKEYPLAGGFDSTEKRRMTYPAFYIETNDIEKQLQKIVSLGGKITAEKKAVGDFGFDAKFIDTEGNHLSLWQSKRR